MGAVPALSVRVDRMGWLLADWRLGLRSGPLFCRQRGGVHVTACGDREEVVRATVRQGESGQQEGCCSLDYMTFDLFGLAVCVSGESCDRRI